MKTLLLSSILAISTIAVNAQGISGLSISPAGATADDQITIILNPAEACNAGTPGITVSTSAVRMHSGLVYASDTAGNFQSEVSAGPVASGGSDVSIVGLVQQANGTWTKTFVPRQYFSTNATGAGGGAVQPGQQIAGMTLLFNAGEEGSTRWDVKAANSTFAPGGNCDYWKVFFPIAGPIAVTSAKSKVNNTFSVVGNQPNPFASTTVIKFNMKKADQVTVRVINLLGETVSVLANGRMDAGEQKVEWNAANASAGIYFFSIEAGSVAETRKMSLVK